VREAGKRTERAASSGAAQKVSQKSATEFLGKISPQFAQARQPACISAKTMVSKNARKRLGLWCDCGRNLWQQWVLKKNMMQ
jgi:hypothetical protein